MGLATNVSLACPPHWHLLPRPQPGPSEHPVSENSELLPPRPPPLLPALLCEQQSLSPWLCHVLTPSDFHFFTNQPGAQRRPVNMAVSSSLVLPGSIPSPNLGRSFSLFWSNAAENRKTSPEKWIHRFVDANTAEAATLMGNPPLFLGVQISPLMLPTGRKEGPSHDLPQFPCLSSSCLAQNNTIHCLLPLRLGRHPLWAKPNPASVCSPHLLPTAHRMGSLCGTSGSPFLFSHKHMQVAPSWKHPPSALCSCPPCCYCNSGARTFHLCTTTARNCGVKD